MEVVVPNAKRHKSGAPTDRVDVEVRMRQRGSFTSGVERSVATFLRSKGRLAEATTFAVDGKDSEMGEDVIAVTVAIEGSGGASVMMASAE
jgi:hypothetical protein